MRWTRYASFFLLLFLFDDLLDNSISVLYSMDDPFRIKYTRYGFEKVNDKRFDRMFKHVAYTILCRCYSLLSKKDKVIYTVVDSPGFVFVVANVVDAGCNKIPQEMV